MTILFLQLLLSVSVFLDYFSALQTVSQTSLCSAVETEFLNSWVFSAILVEKSLKCLGIVLINVGLGLVVWFVGLLKNLFLVLHLFLTFF